MELNKSIIDELSNLKDLIGVSEDYEKFIKYFAFIINDHHVFDRKIETSFSLTNKDALFVNLSNEFDYTIYANPIKIKALLNKVAKIFYKEYADFDTREIDLMFVFAFLIHELMHLDQMNLAKYDKSPIGRTYELIINQTDKRRMIAFIMYMIRTYHICYERTANIVGFRETKKIYKSTDLENICSLFYLYYLSSGYDIKSDTKIITPVEQTFKDYLIKESIDSTGVSFIDIMEHGLPLGQNNLNNFYELFRILENGYLSDIDSDDVIKKMLEMR